MLLLVRCGGLQLFEVALGTRPVLVVLSFLHPILEDQDQLVVQRHLVVAVVVEGFEEEDHGRLERCRFGGGHRVRRLPFDVEGLQMEGLLNVHDGLAV